MVNLNKKFISEVGFEVRQLQSEVQGEVRVQGHPVFQHLPVLCLKTRLGLYLVLTLRQHLSEKMGVSINILIAKHSVFCRERTSCIALRMFQERKITIALLDQLHSIRKFHMRNMTRDEEWTPYHMVSVQCLTALSKHPSADLHIRPKLSFLPSIRNLRCIRFLHNI